MTSPRKIKHKIILSIILVLLIAMAATMSRFYLLVQNVESERLRITAQSVSKGFGVFMDYSADILIPAEMVDIYHASTPFNVKLTSEAVRNPENVPDDWEKRQLEVLEGDPSIPYIYEREPEKSKGSSRFIMPLVARQTCLKCHGLPVGEIDERGFPKEGFELGELAGAVSFTIPVEYANPFTRLQDLILWMGVALTTIMFIFTIYLFWRD